MTIKSLNLSNEKGDVFVKCGNELLNLTKDKNVYVNGECTINLKCGFNILVELDFPQTVEDVLSSTASILSKKMEGIH